MGMTNKTKGWAAGALGGALLLGTGGTFALWSAQDALEGATVTTGSMTVIAADTIEWDGVLVPNDSVQGTFTVTPSLVGDLEGDLTVTWQPGELPAEFTGGIDVDFDGVIDRVTPDTEPFDVTVTVSLRDIDDVAVGGVPGDTMGQDLNLGSFVVELGQTSPAAP